MEAGTDLIQQEARRRAAEGYDRPVFQRGQLPGLERVYSDMLLALLLRGRRPEIFRETASRAESTTSITICGGCLATTPIASEIRRAVRSGGATWPGVLDPKGASRP
jgi:hypothetical protein